MEEFRTATIGIETYTSDIVPFIETLRPEWDIENLVFKVFTGGLTNRLVGCREEGDSVWTDMILFRLYGENTGDVVDRNREVLVLKMLEEAGLGEKLYCRFANGMAYKFKPGTSLSNDTVREAKLSKTIARAVAGIHSIDCGKILRKLSQDDQNIPEGLTETKCSAYPMTFLVKIQSDVRKVYGEGFMSKEEMRNEINELQTILDKSQEKFPLSLCHNDLIPGNIIVNDVTGDVHFIDWEYSSYSIRPLDAGIHFCGYCFGDDLDFKQYPSIERQKEWIRTYFKRLSELEGRDDADTSEDTLEAFRYQANICAMLYAWVVITWAIVQQEDAVIQWNFEGCAVSAMSLYRDMKSSILVTNSNHTK